MTPSQTGDGPSEPLRVRDADRVLEFQGTRIAYVSTESASSPRWTEMSLFHLTDGTDRYVLQTVGRSVVYHGHHSECNSGTAVRAFDLPEDAEPCTRCRPPTFQDCEGEVDDSRVDLESDRYSVYVCALATDVIARLRISRANSTALDSFSAPAMRLLDHARQVDAGIAGALQVVERL
jgi:hypothetical protein